MPQDATQLPKPIIPLPLPMLIDYLDQWRAEPTWPNVTTDVVLLLYDLLMLAGLDEADMRTILGDEAVSHICQMLNTPALHKLTDLVPWEPFPGQLVNHGKETQL